MEPYSWEWLFLQGCSGDEEYDVDGISHIQYISWGWLVSDGTVLTTPVVLLSLLLVMLCWLKWHLRLQPIPSDLSVDSLVKRIMIVIIRTTANCPMGCWRVDKTSLYSGECILPKSLWFVYDEEAAKTLDNLDGYLAPVVISSVDNGNVRPSSDLQFVMYINYAKTNSLINDEADVIVEQRQI